MLIEDGILGAYQSHMEDLHKEAFSTKRIEEYFKTESKASQLMNPYIIVPFLKQIVTENFGVISDSIDRIVSTLIAINCLFIGNYKLKDQIWVLITSILEQVRRNI